ncbi:MAG: CHAT domain-containing protein [Candidatus Xenobiia bacterium LiM19]
MVEVGFDGMEIQLEMDLVSPFLRNDMNAGPGTCLEAMPPACFLQENSGVPVTLQGGQSMNIRTLMLSCLVLSLMVLTLVSVPALGNDDVQLERNAGYIKASGIFLEAVKCMNNYELDKAEKLFKDAAVIYKELGYNKELFLVYQQLTGIALQKGEYEQAMKMIKERQHFLAAVNDPSIEMNELFSLAVVYMTLGDMKKAIEYFEKDYSLAEKQNNADEMMKCDLRIAFIEGYQGKVRKARKRLDNAASYLSRVSKNNVLQYYTQCGYIEYRDKDYKKAREWYTKALQGYCADEALKVYGAPEILLRLAEVNEDLGQSGEAGRCYREALEIAGSQKQPGMAMMPEHLKVITVCNLALGNTAEADKACRSLDEYPVTVNKYICWHYHDIARAYEKAGLLEKACEYYKKAIQILEDVMSLMLTVESRENLFEGKIIYLYDYLIKVLHKMKKDDEAYLYVEGSRSRALLDMLARGGVNITKDVPPAYRDEVNKLYADIRRKCAIVENEAVKPKDRSRDALIKERLAELEKLKQSYNELLKKIGHSNNEYEELKSVKPCRLADIQKLIPDDAVLLEYFIGKESAFLFVIDRNDFKIHDLKIDGEKLCEEKLLDLVVEARQSIMENTQTPDETKKILAQLYSILVEPAKSEIEGKKMLIVVPHRWLQVIPFTALVDGSGAYLVSRYQVVQEPSASAMKLCLEKKRSAQKRSAQKRFTGFALGNITVEKDGEKYSPLPGTIREVDSVAELYSDKELFKNEAMTVGNLKAQAAKTLYLHIATHGVIDSSNPTFSRLIMADDVLSVKDIFNISVATDFVTLSACKTGLGSFTEGDELIGLSRAFFYAGTPSLMVSMWSVSDESTAEFMKEFYKSLVKGNTKAEALRDAELTVMKKYPAPFYWAPFVLMGDWR